VIGLSYGFFFIIELNEANTKRRRDNEQRKEKRKSRFLSLTQKYIVLFIKKYL